MCALAEDPDELQRWTVTWPHPQAELAPVRSPQQALVRLQVGWVDLLIWSGRPDPSFLEAVRRAAPSVPVLWAGPAPIWLDAFDDHIPPPFDPKHRRLLHWMEHVALRRELHSGRRDELSHAWVGLSDESISLRQQLPTWGRSRQRALILGPPGSGKSQLALLMHGLSDRAEGPFEAVHCGALEAPALKRELFGERRGAFTQAVHRAPGRWARAEGGTLLLQHVECLATSVQSLVLERLAEDPDGGPRVVATAGPDLRRHVTAGRFRDDLASALSPIRIQLSSLQNRPADVVPLAAHFVAQSCRALGRRAYLSEPASRYLEGLAWPHNVRELRDRLEQVVLQVEGSITVEHLRRHAALSAQPTSPKPRASGEGPAGMGTYKEEKAWVLRAFERTYLTNLLELERGHVSNAAGRAGMDRKNLSTLLKRHGLDPKSFKPARIFARRRRERGDLDDRRPSEEAGGVH